MGITTDNFFENIYSVIFSPKEFFERKDIEISVREAIGVVVLVSTVYKLSLGIANKSIIEPFFIFSLIFGVLGSVIMWFLTALFFEYIAKIFDKGNKLKEILFFGSFATVPYIFFIPSNLLKNAGEVGYVIAIIIELFLYSLIILYYAYALKAVYNLTLSRSFMLILLPFISSVFASNWLISFILKMRYIFSL